MIVSATLASPFDICSPSTVFILSTCALSIADLRGVPESKKGDRDMQTLGATLHRKLVACQIHKVTRPSLDSKNTISYLLLNTM